MILYLNMQEKKNIEENLSACYKINNNHIKPINTHQVKCFYFLFFFFFASSVFIFWFKNKIIYLKKRSKGKINIYFAQIKLKKKRYKNKIK